MTTSLNGNVGVTDPDATSGTFTNVMELLHLSGY